MTQKFNVIRCFSCSTFQVHQMKKSQKWACKVCGEKQSLMKIYGQGTGAECRQHVQKLNLRQQDMDEKDYQMIINQDFLDISEEPDCPNFTSGANQDMKWPQHSQSSSKWSKFLPCEMDTETNQLQMEEADYIKENNKEKKADLQEFNKFPCQEKRKNPFSEICSRDSFTNSGYLMKKPRTAPKCDFQLSSVNSDKSNNWSHNVLIESRNPGSNLIHHQSFPVEQLSSNVDGLASNKSHRMSPNDMELSKSRKEISHMFSPSKNLPRFTACKETNIKSLKETQFDEEDVFQMAKSQSCFPGVCIEGNDFLKKDCVVNSLNIQSGHSKSLNCENGLKDPSINNMLQRNNFDKVNLSSSVNNQKTIVDGQILPLSLKLYNNKQNNVIYSSHLFSNNLDKGKLEINSTQSNPLKNLFQLDESEFDLEF